MSSACHSRRRHILAERSLDNCCRCLEHVNNTHQWTTGCLKWWILPIWGPAWSCTGWRRTIKYGDTSLLVVSPERGEEFDVHITHRSLRISIPAHHVSGRHLVPLRMYSPGLLSYSSGGRQTRLAYQAPISKRPPTVRTTRLSYLPPPPARALSRRRQPADRTRRWWLFSDGVLKRRVPAFALPLPKIYAVFANVFRVTEV